jgi:hypothetical protein
MRFWMLCLFETIFTFDLRYPGNDFRYLLEIRTFCKRKQYQLTVREYM